MATLNWLYKSVIKKNNFETLFDTAFKADTDYLLKVKIQILLSLSSFQIHILKLTVFRQVKIGREKKKSGLKKGASLVNPVYAKLINAMYFFKQILSLLHTVRFQ